MAYPRYSIKQILGAVAGIALAIALLNSVSILMASLLHIGVIGFMLSATVAVIYFRGARRAYWLGVVLFGGTYMTLVFSPWFESYRYVFDAPLKALRRAAWTVETPRGVYPSNIGEMDNDYDEATGLTQWWPAWHTFGVAAHCLAALLFAFVGGWISRRIYFASQLDDQTST